MSNRVLTCVYCGHEYPQDTPAHGDKVLTDHIAACEKHPMRAVVTQRDMLRRALVGVIGADNTTELRAMEMVIRAQPAPASDKAVALDAIHALLETAQ